jgi:hypothetical protein
MEMPEAAFERLAWLKEKTEAASYAGNLTRLELLV